jgi:hypothetical protein
MSSPHRETAWSLTRRSPAERCAGICYRILARQLFRSRGRGRPGKSGPAISANARFAAYSTNNVTVTTSLATTHETNG